MSGVRPGYNTVSAAVEFFLGCPGAGGESEGVPGEVQDIQLGVLLVMMVMLVMLVVLV